MSEVGEKNANVASELSWRTFRIAAVAILLLAAVLRIWGLDQVPPGLFCDEAGNGYNAYSLLKSGRDEEGKFLPLYVWSFGVSYKNPIFIYSAIPIVAVLGLSEFSIRLCAALWGILGVAAVLWLGVLMLNRRGGLWSAAFLAVSPWHVHFSRIAFELIAFLPFFAAGLGSFLKATRGDGRWLIPSAVLFALSLYTYAPAKMFVPLFILIATLVYFRAVMGIARWVLPGVAAALLTGLPLAIFDWQHSERTGQYFRETTILDTALPFMENAQRVAARWATFFSRDFLFLYGDPHIRHSVPDIGQLYYAMAPLLLLGMVWALRRRCPQGKVILAWLVLFPLPPSFMNEVPSASRGFIGVAAFSLLAAAGAVAFREWMHSRNRLVGIVRDGLMSLFFAVLLCEVGRYGYRYLTSYPVQAADDFQYGYGPAIARMEEERDAYDTLMITTSQGNQAQIFPLFYNSYEPERWLERFHPGYVITDPAEFGRYDPKEKRVLAALREKDLGFFDEVRIVDRILHPTGKVSFVIAEIVERGFFLRDWMLLGAFDNRDGSAQQMYHVRDFWPTLDAYVDGGEKRYWRRILPQFVRIELHHFFRRFIEPSGEPPIWACAYATSQLEAQGDAEVVLELEGTVQWLEGWLNGVALHRRAEQLGGRRAAWPMVLKQGRNQLLIKTCRGDADWFFTARLRGKTGGKPTGITSRASVGGGVDLELDPEEPQQIVSGFASIVSFPHTFEADADYRGPSPGWVEHLYDADGAVTWLTAPLPNAVATAVAFTGYLSPQPGRADLWVDGKHALTFDTGRFETPRRWQGNGFVLRYEAKARSDYYSGPFVLEVPARNVRAGQPLELRVSHVDGAHDAAFMLKGRSDTAEHEGVTLLSLRERNS